MHFTTSILFGAVAIVILQIVLSFLMMEATHAVSEAAAEDKRDAVRDHVSCYKIRSSSSVDVQEEAAASSSLATTLAPTQATRADSDESNDGLKHLRRAALVVLAYNRPKHLKRTINSIKRARHFDQLAARFISVDGNDQATVNAAKSFCDDSRFESSPDEDDNSKKHKGGFRFLQHDRSAPPAGMGATFSLAAHYKFVFDHVFYREKTTGGGESSSFFSHIIVLEDDMDVGDDIFSFFDTYTPVLNRDPSIWCISSWNDNAFAPPLALDKHRAFRSSYFPGLGWMMKRELWTDELSKSWPGDNWDHWMRVSSTHKQRSCIVPFVSRNFNFGDEGSTADEDFFNKYLSKVSSTGRRNKHDKTGIVPVDFKFDGMDASASSSSDSPFPALTGGEEAYDGWLQQQIASAVVARNLEEVDVSGRGYQSSELGRFLRNKHPSTILPYLSEEFESKIAGPLSLHPFPRTHYKFVTWLPLPGNRNLFLVDRRQSPFAPDRVKVLPQESLEPVVARGTGISCSQVCSEHGSGDFSCDASQFDFINNCESLQEAFPHCACQQGWGEDIPNMEAASIHHPGPPNCLVTEMKPTCGASHPLTTRLCPCVKRGVQ